MNDQREYTYRVDAWRDGEWRLLEDRGDLDFALEAAREAVASGDYREVEVWCEQTDTLVWRKS